MRLVNLSFYNNPKLAEISSKLFILALKWYLATDYQQVGNLRLKPILKQNEQSATYFSQ